MRRDERKIDEEEKKHRIESGALWAGKNSRSIIHSCQTEFASISFSCSVVALSLRHFSAYSREFMNFSSAIFYWKIFRWSTAKFSWVDISTISPCHDWWMLWIEISQFWKTRKTHRSENAHAKRREPISKWIKSFFFISLLCWSNKIVCWFQTRFYFNIHFLLPPAWHQQWIPVPVRVEQPK